MIRKRIENWFGDLAKWIYNHKFLALIGVLCLTFILTAQLPKLRFDTRDESFFHEDDPILVQYNRFRDTFGQDDMFIIGMRPKSGLDLSFFSILHELHQKLEANVPYLDDIQSLVNGRVMRSEGDTLHVEDLMKEPPKNAADLERVMKLINRYPLYDGLLISADRSVTSIIIKARAVIEVESDDLLTGFENDDDQSDEIARNYLSNEQNVEMADAIRKIVADYQGQGIEFFFSGTPVFVADFEKAIQKDLGIMMPLSLLIIVLFLTILFRRITGVIYPVIIVFLSLLSCLGVMALIDIPITHVIQILPTFLIVVGIGDSVHILTIFYRNFQASGNKNSAIIRAVSFSGLPILMTSVTTSCGLLSFVLADVAAVAQLGYVAPVGVMLAFFYTIILLTALIAIFPIRPPKKKKATDGSIGDRMFQAIARTTCQYPIRISFLSFIILSLATYFAFSVKLSHNAMTWFPKDAPVRAATELLNKVNGGTVMLEVTIDTGSENGLHNPLLLSKLDKAASDISKMNVNNIQAGKAWSIADVIKEINRALNEDNNSAYTLPTNRELIAQELILFESSGSDDMEDFTDSTYQIGRLSILAPFTDSVLYKDYVDSVWAYLAKHFRGLPVKLTGHLSLFVQITKHFITSMIKSYGFALIIITVLMLVMIGRIHIGLMSMVANVGPIVCIFGIMGIMDIPLDMATILIGSIVLGLVVDDTIHFLHHFRRAYDETGHIQQAVYETLSTTGRALIITSLVLSGGFFIFTGSYLASNVRFGVLSATAVLFALMADFFLIPALLQILYGKRDKVQSMSTLSSANG